MERLFLRSVKRRIAKGHWVSNLSVRRKDATVAPRAAVHVDGRWWSVFELHDLHWSRQGIRMVVRSRLALRDNGSFVDLWSSYLSISSLSVSIFLYGWNSNSEREWNCQSMSIQYEHDRLRVSLSIASSFEACRTRDPSTSRCALYLHQLQSLSSLSEVSADRLEWQRSTNQSRLFIRSQPSLWNHQHRLGLDCRSMSIADRLQSIEIPSGDIAGQSSSLDLRFCLWIGHAVLFVGIECHSCPGNEPCQDESFAGRTGRTDSTGIRHCERSRTSEVERLFFP